MEKPRILFCSAGESINVLNELAAQVIADRDGEWAVPTLWNTSVFTLGESFLDSLLAAFVRVDFAVILCTADDEVKSKGRTSAAPRDNLIFELGMAISQLGPNRVALVRPSEPDLKIPSDYLGRTHVTYHKSEPEADPQEYFFRPAHKVRTAFQKEWDYLKQTPEAVINNIDETPRAIACSLHVWPNDCSGGAFVNSQVLFRSVLAKERSDVEGSGFRCLQTF